jgi:hypothetical protein
LSAKGQEGQGWCSDKPVADWYDSVMYCDCFLNLYTERGRNSELVINKNKILPKVIGTNFRTSQFTVVLNFLKVNAYIKIPALRDTLGEKPRN